MKTTRVSLILILLIECISFHGTFSIDQTKKRNQPQLEPHSNQIYLDVRPANTSHHLWMIRQLPLSTYRYSYDRERIRVGVVLAGGGGSDEKIQTIIPEAVDILPMKRLPDKRVLKNVPIVNEQTLFFYGIGAIQELDFHVHNISQHFQTHSQKMKNFNQNLKLVEQKLEKQSDGKFEFQVRQNKAQVKSMEAKISLEKEKLKHEVEYIQSFERNEVARMERDSLQQKAQLKHSLKAQKIQHLEKLKHKLQTSTLLELSKQKSQNSLNEAQNQRLLEIQKQTHELERQKELLIIQAKADAERMNEDVHLRKMEEESKQKRLRNLEMIQTLFDNFASSFKTIIENPKQVMIFVGFVILGFSGIYFAREFAKFIRLVIESTIGKPKLIRETTRTSYFKSLFLGIREYYQDLTSCNNSNTDEVESYFQDLILPHNLKTRIVNLSKSSQKARFHRAPLRHILLYGSPGTGKTMVAKKLAHSIKMDYALMSGGDVGPLGDDAVTQIHALFTWAKQSPRGVLLFIDEAEAFLASRNKGNSSGNSHNALNALLYHTSSQRNDFVLVLATNRAQDLDSAILDRCDESILFPLPNTKCRLLLVQQYFDMYVTQTLRQYELSKNSNLRKFIDWILDTKQDTHHINNDSPLLPAPLLNTIVKCTNGFSGREIGKLMIALQSLLYTSQNMRLEHNDIVKVLEIKVKEHYEKNKMMNNGIAVDENDCEQ